MSTILMNLKARLLDSKKREYMRQEVIRSQLSKEDADNMSADIDNIKFERNNTLDKIEPRQNMKINIEDVKYRYSLLKELYQAQKISIPDLANELDIKATDLMQFILSNRDYFALSLPLAGKGLEIVRIYDSLEDNPMTNEWLEKMKKTYAKTIWMIPIREFNNIMGWGLTVTKNDPDPSVFPNENRATKWKNTPEKVEAVKKLGYLHKQQFYFGPYNERHSEIIDNSILDAEKKDVVEKFKSAGWKIIFENPKTV